MPAFSSGMVYRLFMVLPLILFALSAHEFMHAYVSRRLGDPTAEREGRLTLSPFAHLDPIGTLVLVLSSLTGFGFGWAKPVPINPAYYRNPVRGVFQVSLAGPLTNLALAMPFGLAVRFAPLPYDQGWAIRLLEVLWYGMGINLGLFLFNLIPLAPLDGSKVLAYFLRGSTREWFTRLQPYGPLILLMLYATRVIEPLLQWPFGLLSRLLTGLG